MIAPAASPAPSARARDCRASSSRLSLTASAARYTAARYAEVATASTPIRIDVGFNQLVIRLPAALPTGTRCEAIPPIAAPNAKGVRIEESAETVSTDRTSRAVVVHARSAYAAPRKMIPTAAMNSATQSVEAIEPNATG